MTPRRRLWYDDVRVVDEGRETIDPTVRLPDVNGDRRGYVRAHDVTKPNREWNYRIEKTLLAGRSIAGWVPFMVDRDATLRVGLTHDLGDGASHTVRWRGE